MATFDGSSLEEFADSLGAGRQVDAEIAEALGEVEQRNAAKGGRQVPLPPKRLFGEVRPSAVKGAPDELWAWSEVDGKMYERPHPATNDEAMALQRGVKIPQAGFQQMGDASAAEDKTLWQKIPTWVKLTAAGVVVVGGTLLVEHYAVPKVKQLLGKGEDGDDVIDVDAEPVEEMPSPEDIRLLLAAAQEE